jgi:hypothetical protein
VSDSRIEGKIDAIQVDIAGIKVEQAKQGKDIEHHIKRTDLLEDEVKVNRRLMYLYVICAAAILGPQLPKLLELLQVLLQTL